MKLKKYQWIACMSMVLLLAGCASSGTAAHGASSKESMVESIAAQSAASAEGTQSAPTAQTTPPVQTAPPTAVAGGSSESASAPDTALGVHPTAHDDIDVDLTMLSDTMVYSEVYNIMNNPLTYIGKKIRMGGEFALYINEIDNLQYYACIITDATACCANGIEFERAGDYVYPDDFPEIGEEIVVTGVFEIYEENGLKYVHLKDAEMTVP